MEPTNAATTAAASKAGTTRSSGDETFSLLDKTFPARLYRFLSIVEEYKISHIASWQPHGRSFRIHNPDDFVKLTEPSWFVYRKYASLQRQLNIYGFIRITKGIDKDCYYHKFFLRGQGHLIHKISRIPVKNRSSALPLSTSPQPDFYSMTSDPTTSETNTNQDSIVPSSQLIRITTLHDRNEHDSAGPRINESNETNHIVSDINANASSAIQSISSDSLTSSMTAATTAALNRQLYELFLREQSQVLNRSLLPYTNTLLPTTGNLVQIDQNHEQSVSSAMASSTPSIFSSNDLARLYASPRLSTITQLLRESQQQAATRTNTAISSHIDLNNYNPTTTQMQQNIAASVSSTMNSSMLALPGSHDGIDTLSRATTIVDLLRQSQQQAAVSPSSAVASQTELNNAHMRSMLMNYPLLQPSSNISAQSQYRTQEPQHNRNIQPQPVLDTLQNQALVQTLLNQQQIPPNQLVELLILLMNSGNQADGTRIQFPR